MAILTECLLGLDQAEGELSELWQLLEELSHLIVSGTQHATSVDGLDHVSHANLGETRDQASFPHTFDKGKPRPIVGDGEAEGRVRLVDLDKLGGTLDMGEDEVL